MAGGFSTSRAVMRRNQKQAAQQGAREAAQQARAATRAAAPAANNGFSGGAGLPPHLQSRPPAAVGPAPVPTPAPGPPPVGMPWDAADASLAEGLAASRRYREEVAQGQRNDLVRDFYGYGNLAEWEAAGRGFNADDPFSRAAQLNRSYRDRQRGSLNSMASVGQLYSGARSRQDVLDQDWYSTGVNDLSRLYMGGVGAIDQGLQQGYEQDASNLYAQWLGTLTRLASDPSTAAPAPEAPPAGGGGGGQQAGAGARGSRYFSGVTRNGVDIGILDQAMKVSPGGISRAQMAERLRQNPGWGPYTAANNGKVRGHSLAF